MPFKQAPPIYTNLKWSSHPLYPSERKQTCNSLFSGCTWSKFLPTQQQQWSSPHGKLSRSAGNEGCIPNRWRHHGHKPETSCQPLGRRGFCMTKFRRVVYEPFQALSSPEPALRMVDKTLSFITDWSKMPSMCNCKFIWPPFGCIIDINHITDYLQKQTICTSDCTNLSIV